MKYGMILLSDHLELIMLYPARYSLLNQLNHSFLSVYWISWGLSFPLVSSGICNLLSEKEVEKAVCSFGRPSDQETEGSRR